jgi:phospholipid transport system substrate-binding protein
MRFVIACMLLLVGAVATAAVERPRDLVEKSAETVLSTLVERREEFRREPAKLEAFVLGELDRTFDHQYSARLVLGRHGRGVPEAQIDAFSHALSTNLMRRYGKAMLDFDPKIDVKVLSETPLRDGSVVRVATQLERADGPPVPVDYMVRKVGAEWKVFDVLVEGVSYVQTFRAQFEEQLRDHTLDQVIAGLRDGSVHVGD